MTAYYNENDAHAAGWLRNLVAAGHLPAGDVDDRSILEVEPGDLDGYDQCHFFAGIGGWPYALDLAGWTGPVWTGSCPCQPLSSAGQRKGHADERHLWPAFQRLIAECRPATVFGEQVASKDGREWLAGIRADLEHLGYAVGAADLPAAGVGAPHIRQRLFWVASAAGMGRAARPGDERRSESRPALARNGSATGGLGDAEVARCEIGSRLAAVDGSPARQGSQQANLCVDALGGLGDAESERGGEGRQGRQSRPPAGLRDEAQRNHWEDAVWLGCLDGKARRAEPGVFPLADGVPARVGRLRAYGNAIVPQAAAACVTAFMEISDAAN